MQLLKRTRSTAVYKRQFEHRKQLNVGVTAFFVYHLVAKRKKLVTDTTRSGSIFNSWYLRFQNLRHWTGSSLESAYFPVIGLVFINGVQLVLLLKVVIK